MSEQTPIPQEPRQLKQLLADWQTAVSGTNLPQPPVYTGDDITITQFTEKTSEVTPGTCFVARVRQSSDGHPYIGKAVEQGATLILAQRPLTELDITLPENVVYLQVADTAQTLAWLAAAWEGFPSRQLVMIGVTGTDGKTTTCNILHHLLTEAGLKVGLLSTIKAVIGEKEEPLELHVTTPEAPVVQSQLRRMVDAGLTHCILESTSHGLAQHRVSAIDFDIAVVTNISHEHLDYHGTPQNYFAAKALLFQALNADDWAIHTENESKKLVLKTAVLNKDDKSYPSLLRIGAPRQVSYGLVNDPDVFADNIAYTKEKTWFDLHFQEPLGLFKGEAQPPKMDFKVPGYSPLVGEFNLYNILATVAVARILQVTPEIIQEALKTIFTVKGRMEKVTGLHEATVVIDFAHTPNSLRNAIDTGRKMVKEHKGRVITVFGSAGKRDVEKRRIMAEISARYADITILTAEDPRTESLDDILEMMAFGCKNKGGIEGDTFWRIPDRGEAIYFALSIAKKWDIVMVCGKGHEQSMCFGTTEYPWDERTALTAALTALAKGDPMPDLGLPTGAG